jgi:hypothetical protein
MHILAAHPDLAGYLSGQVPARGQIDYCQALALNRTLHWSLPLPLAGVAQKLHPAGPLVKSMGQLINNCATVR